MGLYDAQKMSIYRNMNLWANARINDNVQRLAKGIPCHVTKVDKDFVEVQFDTQGGGLTPPTVKMPVSYSAYSREPTQVGDKGYAVPSDYNLDGNNGWAQGAANYYPRGNLAPLSFQPIAHTSNPKRDYDQHTIVGGPNGVYIVQSNPPQQNQQQQTSQTSSGSTGSSSAVANMRRVRLSRSVPGMGYYAAIPRPQHMTTALAITGPEVTPFNGSSSNGSSSSGSTSGAAPGQPASDMLPPVPDPQTDIHQSNKGSIMIDKNSKHTFDGTQKHLITINQQSSRITVEVPADQSHFIWLGGPGTDTSKYAPVSTTKGPCINVKGKYKPGDG